MKRSCATSIALAFLAGFAGCRPAAVAPPPPAAPEPAAPAPAVVRVHQHETAPVRTCVVQNGRFAEASLMYHPETGDSTVNGRPFREVYPLTAEYAASARWYVNDEPITFAGRRWVKYGLPRVLDSSDVLFAGTHEGVAVFVDGAGDPARPTGYIYVVTDPRCEFQPYTVPGTAGAVRG